MIESILRRESYTLFLAGQAGSGKSTLAKRISADYEVHLISIDDYFLGTSDDRRATFYKILKAGQSFRSYCTMLSWWDWSALDATLNDARLLNKRVIVEGALLGPPRFWDNFDSFLFLYVPCEQRFMNLVDRDLWKRGPSEFCTRFLTTNFAEGFNYKLFISRLSLSHFNSYVAVIDRALKMVPAQVFLKDLEQSIGVFTQRL